MVKTSGDITTVWYNYTLASAGSIFDENTSTSNPATNINPATESVCPKGWTLPSKAQVDRQRNTGAFSPVLGGGYSNSSLTNETTAGYWWGSGASNGAERYRLNYNGTNLLTGLGDRQNAYYIRCVAKQKTITDLAYMQDVTDEVNFGEVWRI